VICEICDLSGHVGDSIQSEAGDGWVHVACVDQLEEHDDLRNGVVATRRDVVDSLTAERFSYPRWRQHRGCERKVGYHCQLDANAAIMRAYDRGATQLRTYECDHCGLLHLTKDVKETA
jgi:hypothetical protein